MSIVSPPFDVRPTISSRSSQITHFQGGQHLLNFIDFFGVSFVVFVMGIAQLITFCWIYGVDRLCFDIQFMLGFKTGWYWRICWSIVTPALMIAIFIYFVVELAQSSDPITYKDQPYPNVVYSEFFLSNFLLLK